MMAGSSCLIDAASIWFVLIQALIEKGIEEGATLVRIGSAIFQ